MADNILPYTHIKLLMSDGCRLSVKEFNNTKAPQMVCIFLHGVPISSDEYIHFASILAKTGIKMCLLDMRGHGDSDGDRGKVDYTGQFEDDLQRVILHYKKSNLPLILGGHSAGAAVILRNIVKNGSTLIDQYLFISPAIFKAEMVRYHNPIYYFDYLLTHRKFLRKRHPAPLHIQKMLPKFSIIKLIGAFIFPFLRNKVNVLRFPLASFGKNHSKHIKSYTYNALASMSASRIYQSALSKIDKSTLVLIGSNDEFILPVAMKKAIQAHSQNISLFEYREIINAHHYDICILGIPHLLSWLKMKRII